MSRTRWLTAAIIALVLCAALAALSVGCRIVSGAMMSPHPPAVSLTPSRTAAQITIRPTAVPDQPPPSKEPTRTKLPDSPTPRIVATRRPARTPTASATLEPTPTAASFSLSTPALIAVTPILSDTTPVPTPVPQAEVPTNAINIVLLGSDRRPDWDDWHTDVIQIISVQPAIPMVSILSIPRDLYVYIPGFWMSRINFADMYGELYGDGLHGYEGGGPALVQQTLLYNLGIPVDHYVRVDFGGFIGIVDILGGIDVPVHCRLEDHWPYPDENGEYPIKVLEPGVHHMDGQTALWYSRSRKTTSVFSRERRQQQVLEAIWRKSRSLDVLPRLPQLWEQYRHMVVTDLGLVDILRLAEVAFRLNSQNIRTRSIGYQHVIPWTTPHGGNVFLPHWEEIGPLVAEVMGPAAESPPWTSYYSVEVWNGTPHATWDQLAADRLLRAGFPTVIGKPDRTDYESTQLLDFTPENQAGATSHLRWMFRVAPENVISAPNPDAGVQYRLVLGADYETCVGY